MVQYVVNEDDIGIRKYLRSTYTLSSGKYGTRLQGLESVPVGRPTLPNLSKQYRAANSPYCLVQLSPPPLFQHWLIVIHHATIKAT